MAACHIQVRSKVDEAFDDIAVDVDVSKNQKY